MPPALNERTELNGPGGPLAGLTVLDLTRVLSGPYCTMLLADMGARVIKIEQPGRGDETRAWGPPFVAGESAYFLSINRNKESVTLDFKQPGGRAALDRLVERADVLVENFRPGTLDRLGLGYAAVAAAHPRLVYCSISGFGQTGPRRNQAGYDAVMQAEGGLMSVTGAEDGPAFRVGVAIADLAAGLLAAQGIVLALYSRERSGRGQQVDVGMLDSVVSLLTYHASMHLTTATMSQRVGNRHATIAPYDTFTAADGELFLAVGNDDQFRRFCEATGLQALPADGRFATNPARVVHHAALREHLAPVLRTQSRAHWNTVLAQAGVPCGAVRDVPDALSDPQLAARHMIEAVEHAAAGTLKVLGVPIKLSETPGSVRTAPPTLGQHTAQVLAEIGMTPDQIEDVRVDAVDAAGLAPAARRHDKPGAGGLVEVSQVRKRVQAAMASARERAHRRRQRASDAEGAYERFLTQLATPLARQVVNALNAEGYAFTLSTPGRGLRLALDRGRDDFIELALETNAEEPVVIGRTRRTRGSRTIEDERPIKPGASPDRLSEQDVLDFLVNALEPWLER